MTDKALVHHLSAPRAKGRPRVSTVIVVTLGVAFAVVMLSPFLLVAMNSFKSNADYSANGPLALPKALEESTPSFHHHPASSLPVRDHAGALLRVVAGHGFGMESPVQVFADTFNVAVDLDPDAELAIAPEAVERALYVLEGDAQLDGTDIPEKHLLVLDRGARHVLRAKTPLKAMLFGGEPLDAPRHMWWNFVSSSKERIEQAKTDWESGAFGLIPGDDQERIPLPDY